MKKLLPLMAGFILMTLTLTSCEGLFENCKICEMVTYNEDGDEVNRGTPIEYCGAELLAVDGKRVEVGGIVTVYECK